jgi:hypothetical protein
MTSTVQPSTSSILAELTEIADALDRPDLSRSADELREHRRAARLQLLVAGLPTSGRATLVNILLDRPAFLPESPIPKPAHSLKLRHGERVSAVRVGAGDSRAAIPPDSIRTFLTEPPGRQEDRLEVQVPSEVLELCDLRVESIEGHRPPSEWREILGSADYVMFLLNASALLSDVERTFLREHLAPDVGLERVAIVITHMDLTPEEERDSIVDLVRSFLGPFQSQPAILDLSLREIGRQEGPRTDPLTTLVADLLERSEPIRSAALQRTLGVLLDDVERAAEEIQMVYSLEEEDVRRARQALTSQQDWLDQRTLRAQGRIEAFVDTLLKEQLLRRVEGFADALRNRLPSELEAVEDVALIRRHLPGYLQTVWTEFLRGQSIWVRGELMGEEDRINGMIEADLQELVGSIAQADPGMRRDFETDRLTFHVFLTPRRGKHQATNVARGLSLHGFVMLFFLPGLGVLSLAASQVIQRLYKRDIAQADRQALIASATAAIKDLEREIKKQAEGQFGELTEQLQKDVVAAYQDGIKQIAEVLDDRARHGANLEARRKEMASILQERIPHLRAQLGRIGESAA